MKKNFKKFVASILAVLMLVTSVPLSVFAEVETQTMYKFDASNLTLSSGTSFSGGTNGSFSYVSDDSYRLTVTDSVNNTALFGPAWRNPLVTLTNEDDEPALCFSDASIASSALIPACNNGNWVMSMKYKCNTNVGDSNKSTLFGIGSQRTASPTNSPTHSHSEYNYSADLIHVLTNGAVYYGATQDTTAANFTSGTANLKSYIIGNTKRVISFKYEEPTISILVDDTVVYSRTVADSDRVKFKEGPGNIFLGGSSANQGGGTFGCYGDSNTGNCIVDNCYIYSMELVNNVDDQQVVTERKSQSYVCDFLARGSETNRQSNKRINLARSDGACTIGFWKFYPPDFDPDESTVIDASITVTVDEAETYNNNFNIDFYVIPEDVAASYVGAYYYKTNEAGQYTKSLSENDYSGPMNTMGLNSTNKVGSFVRNKTGSNAVANSPYTISSDNLKTALNNCAAAEQTYPYVIVGFISQDCPHSNGGWSDTWVSNVQVDYTIQSVPTVATDDSELIGSSYISSGYPFHTNKPSQNYRIPSLVSLNDGTLVAAADARWNATNDGGGNDVVVGRSTDEGGTWGVDLVNYYGDNGNYFNKSSTAFCDSALATDGNDVWMVSSFFPAGRSINVSSGNDRPEKRASFDGSGRLLLEKTGESGYNYYLDTNAKVNGRYSIRKSSDNSYAKNGSSYYTVDADFYLWDGMVNTGQSVFYNNCLFQAPKTHYLWLRHSTNGGKTWDDARLLNLRKTNEEFFGICPGRGIVTSTGRIVFSGYVYNTVYGAFGYTDYNTARNNQRAYLFWSDDNGQTRKRSTNPVTNSVWSSESQPIELPNGKIRLVFRNGTNSICYGDATFNANGADVTWDSYVNTGIANSSDCQISAIMYPYTIGGKNAVIITCPTRTSGSRMNGVMYTCTVDSSDGYRIKASSATQVALVDNGVMFEYSCMTVLPDGSIAVLYETKSYKINFKIIEPSQFGHGANVNIPQTIRVNLARGETYSIEESPSLLTDYDSDVVHVISTANHSTKMIQGQGNTSNNSNDNHFFTEEQHAKEDIENALWVFDSTGEADTYNIHAATNNNIRITITHAQIGFPCQQNTAGNVNLLSKGQDDYIALRQADGSSYRYLMFFRDGQWGQKYFDSFSISKSADPFTNTNTTYSTQYGVGCSANLFRKAQPGETEDSLIPGYVKLSNASQVVSGEKYLIAYLSRVTPSDKYFVLYPFIHNTGTNYQNCRVSQVALVTGEQITKSWHVTITGNKVGTTYANVGDRRYEITVGDTATVTGAVRYDPVIYTLGSDFASYGTNIADGSEKGELQTNYVVAKNWYIEKIDVVSGANSANIKPSKRTNGGILTGKIDTPNHESTASLESILVKTTLIGPDGEHYIQQDRLWCETNPVTAQAIGITYANPASSSPVAYASAVLGPPYTKSSYEAIQQSSDYSYKGSGALNFRTDANFRNMYTRDGAVVSNANANYTNLYEQNSEKKGGWATYVSETPSGWDATASLTTLSPICHYYYDKSTSYNPSMSKVLTSNNDTFYIDVIYNRALWNDGGNIQEFAKATDLNEQKVTGDISFVGDAYKAKIDGGTWGRYNPKGYQTITLKGDCLNTSGETIKSGTYQLYISRKSHNTDRAVWGVIDQRFRVNVHIINKNTARTYYSQALRGNKSSKVDNFTLTSDELNVLVSTDFTTSTWADYQTKLLELESYLGNYKSVTPNNVPQALNTAYEALEKRATFDELEQELENKATLSTNVAPPVYEDGVQAYEYSSWNTFKTAYNQANTLINKTYSNPETRANTAGYGAGVYNNNKNELQLQIDDLTEKLRTYPVAAADPSAYIAARDLYKTIDYDSYVSNKTQATQEINTGNSDIFQVVNNVEYVSKTYHQQNEVDVHTTAVMNKINSTVGDGIHGKRYNLVVNVNGIQVVSKTLAYGATVDENLGGRIPSSYDAVYTVTYGTSPNIVSRKIPRPSNDRLTFLICSDVTVNITTKNTSAVKVYDYYQNLIATGSEATLSGYTLTVDGVVIEPRTNPGLIFKGWARTEADGVISYRQKASLNGGSHSFSATNGTITPCEEAVNGSIKGFDIAYDVAGPSDTIVWVMQIDGGKSYLASYSPTFRRFTSDHDVVYTAYTRRADMTAVRPLRDLYDKGNPISYGDGYMSGDDGSKFTLSCFYSQAPGTTVVEAGVLYTADSSKINYTDMTKGATGITTLKQAQVGTEPDATYTITKKNAIGLDCAMRSYVCYYKNVTIGGNSSDVAFVEYGPIYRCNHGTISLVE